MPHGRTEAGFMRRDVLKADWGLQASEPHPSVRSVENEVPHGLDGHPRRFANQTKDRVKE